MDSASAITSATTAAGAGGRKKIDDRVKYLLEDCARKKHRSIFLLLGDRSKDQITSIHAMLSRTNHTSRVNVVWCMKNEPLFISTAKSKLRRQGDREIKAGMASEESKDTFETFLSHNDIRFTHYKDTHRILGQTFGMAVLQDFEAMTPNILARTIETVQGGGAILILLRSMSSLRQLNTMTMDVHARYRSDTHGAVIPRFNERFILSLCDCENMIALDDDLAVLPITQNIKNMLHKKQQAANSQAERLRIEGRTKHEAELADLKDRLKDHPNVGPLVTAANTVDQAKTVLGLMQAVAEKTLNTTCAVTAGRGRGKSAALGLVLAGAIKEGYSNILVTAPGPDNLGTLFEFAVKGLKELGYVERNDFTVMLSTNPEFAKCIVAINVFKEHRQTIQFAAATDSEHFRHAEILVVDEAAAIPLPLVQRMIGPYLVFLSSTVSGYEGTGRSLSLKLIADMKKRSNSANNNNNNKSGSSGSAAAASTRLLKELQMSDPIRYGPDDPIESWMNKLLCFDAVSETAVAPQVVPHPSKCDLYYVDRDALFSYNNLAETLLHKIMALLVAAHYKNQPNDLQLLSDAPGHHLFVLCAPPSSAASKSNNNKDAAVETASSLLPDILCVIHASEEGNVTADNLAQNLDRGSRPSGDLIPYTIGQQYLEKTFPKLAGLRVVRIATNPEIQRSGYGSRALDLFCKYYEGKLHGASSASALNELQASSSSSNKKETDQQESSSTAPKPRRSTPALLRLAANRPPAEACEYIGVSFGLNIDLYNFWNRSGFDSIYLRQVANELTGEHSCIMVRSLLEQLPIFDFLKSEFRRRFMALLPLSYRRLSVDLAVCLTSGANGKQNYLETVASKKRTAEQQNNTDDDSASTSRRPDIFVGNAKQITWQELIQHHCFSEQQDFQRLKLYASGVSDVALILDLAPNLASLYFRDMMHFRAPSGNDGVVLSPAQRAILLSVALQGRHFDELSEDKTSSFFGVPPVQLKGIFHKTFGKFVDYLNALKQEKAMTMSVVSKSNQDGEEEDDDDQNDNEEEIRRDAKGNIIGLQVVRKIKKKIETDKTLLHDSGNVNASGGEEHVSHTRSNNNKMSGQRRKRS